MKALSIKQPWASLIVESRLHPVYGKCKTGIKPVENRSKPWKHKGPLAIHAGKKYDEDGWKWIMHNCPCGIMRIAIESRKLTGGFVGSVNMVDCVTEHSSDFFFGPYGYVFENPKKCECGIIPYKGQQGVFNIDLGLHEFLGLWTRFKGYQDCLICGELKEDTTLDCHCLKCGSLILPF